MADYPHVPGFTINVNDGGLVVPISQYPTTETVLIMGPAPNGPKNGETPIYNEPKLITDTTALSEFATAGSLYGTAESRNLLTTAWKQAYDAGCKSIYLMRLEDTGADAAAKTHSMFMSMHTALDLLSSTDNYDHVVVVGLYADDTVTLTASDVTTLGDGYVAGPADIIAELNKFVTEQIQSNNEVLGYIAIKPLGKLNPTLAEIRTYIDSLEDIGDLYSGFVSVVGGIDLAFNAGFEYADNGVAAYAGLASTLDPHSATTNKPVKGARLIFNPTLPMLESLGDKKYVSYRKRNNIVCPTLDVTAAPDSSDFVLLSTARIILAAAKLTREVCEPFIGEGADNNSIAAMETALHKTYKGMIAGKSILDYKFAITMSLQDFLLGKTNITLDIVPCLERRKIRLDITARAQI